MERVIFEIVIVISTALIAHFETKRKMTKDFKSMMQKIVDCYEGALLVYEKKLLEKKDK